MQCSKCGLGPDTETRPERAREYYDRYAAAFHSAAHTNEFTEAARHSPAAPDHPRVTWPRGNPSWQTDYSLIVQAAELVGVTPATVEAIGATGGREYADVTEGRGAPPPPTSRADPRIYAADADVRLFLSDYESLRYAATYVRTPPGVETHLVKAHVPKHEYVRLPDMLPSLDAQVYRATLEATIKENPEKALAFAIQSLCGMVLSVASAGRGGEGAPPPEWLPRLAVAFAKDELAHILRGHRLLSKPGNFDWSMFEAGDDESSLQIQDQAADVGEDVLNDLVTANTEEAPEDPFSEEHIDYDTSENNFDKEDIS